MVKILVLGAYGLIGSACVAALKDHKLTVLGMGRAPRSSRFASHGIEWVFADLAKLSVRDWKRHLGGVDVVVNAAGALQDDLRDDLEAIHVTMVSRLCEAARDSSLRLVHISAAGVSPQSTTRFYRSKARGDAIIQSSNLDWVVLRPTMVIGANAYGGSALLRGAAGLPGLMLRVFDDRPIQTIALPELADAVASCALGHIPMRRVYELTESKPRRLGQVIALTREWLGFSEPALNLPLPDRVVRWLARLADGLGWLGWRSPLRSTAIQLIDDGVTGDASAWERAGGDRFSALPETLARLPATFQDRWFSRLYLLLPCAVALLSAFWILSGLIGMWRFEDATRLLTDRSFGGASAHAAVLGGSILDIILGVLILVRRWARSACLGMVALSLIYLAAATVFVPELWADPLGPLLKVLPSIGLALISFSALEDR